MVVGCRDCQNSINYLEVVLIKTAGFLQRPLVFQKKRCAFVFIIRFGFLWRNLSLIYQKQGKAIARLTKVVVIKVQIFVVIFSEIQITEKTNSGSRRTEKLRWKRKVSSDQNFCSGQR